MTFPQSANAGPTVARHVADDILGLYSQGGKLDYKRTADLVRLSKADLGAISGVASSSVRYDQHIPAPVAEQLREIAHIANHVAEYFDGNASKVALWFELTNPILGNISPRTLIRGGRCQRLRNFVGVRTPREDSEADQLLVRSGIYQKMRNGSVKSEVSV